MNRRISLEDLSIISLCIKFDVRRFVTTLWFAICLEGVNQLLVYVKFQH